MAFATLAQFEARLDPSEELTTDEEALATQLLDDASVILTALVTVDSSDTEQAELLEIVCCNMVKRAMMSGLKGAYGIDDATATMGEFSQRVSYSNPSGDLYVNKTERSLLGISGTKFGSIRPTIELKKVRERWH